MTFSATGPIPRRVVITGLGALTPMGLSAAETWDNVLAGRSGIGPMTRFDPSEIKSKIAAEVKGFDPLNFMSRKESRSLDTYSRFGVAAVQEAIKDAGLEFSREDIQRVGVTISSCVGGIEDYTNSVKTLLKRGMQRVSPFLVPRMLVDSLASRIAVRYGLQGPTMGVTTACSTGLTALCQAFDQVRFGSVDIAICGSSEAAIVPPMVAGFDAMGVLSANNDMPEEAAKPFDNERDGFVIGEGCGILIMETLEHARARGARIYAEVAGGGMSNDGNDMVAMEKNGIGIQNAMRVALHHAKQLLGIDASDVDYINPHGSGTKLNDKVETHAIKGVFGEHAYDVNISSTKSMMGHLMGAAGSVEAIMAVKSVDEDTVPPTINLHTPDPDCDLNYTPNVAQQRSVQAAMNNSIGLGGNNTSMIFSKPD